MKAIALLLALSLTPSLFGQGGDNYLYKAQLLRAEPGKLLSLIELIRQHRPYFTSAGDRAPLVIRHSQGDQWDLFLLYPLGSFAEFYSQERVARRAEVENAASAYEASMLSQVTWQDEVFVQGPPLEEVGRCFEGNRFFHVEMFRALAGKHAELAKEREMENIYLGVLDRPQNLIFVRNQGAGWDCFTIGCYRDIKHFAESADIPEDREEEAAVAAGFEGAGHIGAYLRSLILEHHDTLAVAVP